MTRYFLILVALLGTQGVLAFPQYASGDGFRGATLMTPEERKAHVGRLQGMRTFAECQTYMSAHEADLQGRARAQNVTLPSPSGDPCVVMRNFGRIR